MKRKTAVVISSLLLAAFLLIGGARMFSVRSTGTEKERVAVSFYPMYVIALNLTQGIETVEVVNLTAGQTGCVHDFTLRPQDMVTLEETTAFVINGGGMETFLHAITDAYPNLNVIDSSTGIKALCSNSGHAHDHAHDHEGETENAHFWLSPTNYIQQVENIRDGLIAVMPQYTAQIQENAATYIRQIMNLQAEMHQKTENCRGRSVIILHDAFAYLAEECGLHVAAAVQVERDTALSAAEIAEVMDLVQHSNAKVILAEPEYSPELAAAIARETTATAYTLDTCVSGAEDPDAYITAMKHNLALLLAALSI